MNEFLKKQVAIKNKIAKLQQQLVELRDSCPHDDLTGVFKADTGNWCSDDDSYWVNLSCQDCGKTWSEDQSDVTLVTSGILDLGRSRIYKTKEGHTFKRVE